MMRMAFATCAFFPVFFIVCNVGCIAFNAICGVDHRLFMNMATDYHFSTIYKIQ